MNSLLRASIEFRAIFVMREAMDISMLSLTLRKIGVSNLLSTECLRRNGPDRLEQMDREQL